MEYYDRGKSKRRKIHSLSHRITTIFRMCLGCTTTCHISELFVNKVELKHMGDLFCVLKGII